MKTNTSNLIMGILTALLVLVSATSVRAAWNQSAEASNFTGTITLNKDAELSAVAGGTVNFHATGNGKFTGSGGLIKTGEGTVVLANDNDYTGTTTISEGTLLVN